MKVFVRGDGLTPAQAHGLISTVRTTFRDSSKGVKYVSVVVSLG